MEETLPSEISEFLGNCLSENIQNYKVTLHAGNKKGEGFLGELLFVSLKNKTNNKEHHLVIKQVLPCGNETTTAFMSLFYINEIQLYTRIVPALLKFQESFPEAKPFDNIAKCFGTNSIKGEEKIVLQNLKLENYEVPPKSEFVTDEMYEALFKLYGEYHALNFAFKELQFEQFSELKTTLNNNWLSFLQTLLFSSSLRNGAEHVQEVLKTRKEEEMAKMLQKYVDGADDIFKDIINYKDSYGIFLHGDSWSNNVMFKFNESKKPEHIILLDFQLTYVGSPIFDLSYSFYSGANKETLSKLDHFLKIYHESLSEHLEYYGLKVKEIYPFEVLKQEWKKYCRFGFIMGYQILGVRNMNEEEVPDLSKLLDSKEPYVYKKHQRKGNEYEESIYNLAKHMYDNDFI